MMPCPPIYSPIHPRLKRPVGRRLAAALVALEYNGSGAVTGPTISGCTLSADNTHLTLMFNTTLLRGEHVAITHTQNVSAMLEQELTDASVLFVCTGDAFDCNCLSWHSLSKHGPTVCAAPADGTAPRPIHGANGERGDLWAPAPLSILSISSIAVDTSALNITGGIHAVRFGWAYGNDHCCVDADVKSGKEPCIPGACGVMTSASLLPLNPFFASINHGKCQCPAPQECNE
jgi:hypothetical protein